MTYMISLLYLGLSQVGGDKGRALREGGEGVGGGHGSQTSGVVVGRGSQR